MANGDPKTPLSKLRVVVTRPVEQAKNLITTLESLCAEPIPFPCIEIQNIDLRTNEKSDQARIRNCELFIFTSENAVIHGFGVLQRLLSTNLREKQFAAIGSTTQRALQAKGIPSVLAPNTKLDSEHFLQLAEMADVAGKQILIVKGKGGRTEIADTLSARGATIFCIDVYVREKPQFNDPDLLNSPLDAIMFTSSECVENLLAIAPSPRHRLLLNTQTIVGHQRIASKVRSLGFKKLPIIADDPSDAAMIAALKAWAKRTEKTNE